MHLAHYLSLVHRSEYDLADAFRQIGDHHAPEPDVHSICHALATQCDTHIERLKPFVDRYGEASSEQEPDRLYADLFQGTRGGGIGLLRDLQDSYLLASNVDICWDVIAQAAQGVRDKALLQSVQSCEGETTQQLKWIKSRMNQAAPQALIAGS